MIEVSEEEPVTQEERIQRASDLAANRLARLSLMAKTGRLKKSQLPMQYAESSTTPLEVEVQAGQINDFQLELTD